jgi:hypothetical protein
MDVVTVIELAEMEDRPTDLLLELVGVDLSVADLSVTELSRLAGVLVLIRNPGPASPLLED